MWRWEKTLRESIFLFWETLSRHCTVSWAKPITILSKCSFQSFFCYQKQCTFIYCNRPFLWHLWSQVLFTSLSLRFVYFSLLAFLRLCLFWTYSSYMRCLPGFCAKLFLSLHFPLGKFCPTFHQHSKLKNIWKKKVTGTSIPSPPHDFLAFHCATFCISNFVF